MCDGDWLGKPQPHVSLKSYAVVKNRDVKYVWKGKACWEASVIVPRPAPCPPVTLLFGRCPCSPSRSAGNPCTQ